MHKMQKHFGQIFEAKKWNIIRMQLGQEKIERYEWEEQTGTSKDFAGEAEEDIDEDPNWKALDQMGLKVSG